MITIIPLLDKKTLSRNKNIKKSKNNGKECLIQQL